jgi:hypothetical protein
MNTQQCVQTEEMQANLLNNNVLDISHQTSCMNDLYVCSLDLIRFCLLSWSHMTAVSSDSLSFSVSAEWLS